MVDPVKMHALSGQLAHEFRLNAGKIVLAQAACPDPGLIGDHHPGESRTFESTQCLGDARQEVDVAGIGTVAHILDQRAVPIEENGRAPRCRGHGRPVALVSDCAGSESGGTAEVSATGTGRASGTPSTTVMSPTAPPAARTPTTSMR